jgi:3,4-dihydroxyphenylacetate 2,3-dioxygenase
MEWFRSGRHDEILRATPEYRSECSPEGRFSHYLMMAGAMGGAEWNWRGEQFGRYEAALGTGQALFYFDRQSTAAHQGAQVPAGGAN